MSIFKAAKNILSAELIEAVSQGDANAVEIKLRAGADPNAMRADGYNAMMLAVANKASQDVKVHIIYTLIKYKANPYISSKGGLTPLHQAAATGQEGIVSYLIKCGVDVNAVTEGGVTALILAALEGQFRTTQLLVQQGAVCDAQDRTGDTALRFAVLQGHTDIVKLLLADGANPNLKNYKGDTVLLNAVSLGQKDIITALVTSGADPNTMSQNGLSALKYTITKGNYSITKLLLEHGAVCDVQDADGVTPLILSALGGHLDIVNLLLAHGANPYARTNTGLTALSAATSQSVVERLQQFSEPKFLNSVAVQEKPTDKTKADVAKPQAVATQVPQQNTSEAILHELQELVGLSDVKADVSQMVNFLRFQAMRREKGLHVPEQSLHMVFTGNPGTGKTTVARLIAQLYQALGILSTGQLIETDRSGLVAGYVGQTAIKVQEVVKSAVGGVLFIDEAYSLNQNGGGQDFGQEAVDTLLKLMEDNRGNLIVIVAGYTELMQKFVKSNPGLQSRFNKFLKFDDYTPAELTEIFVHFAKQGDYNLTTEATAKLDDLFAQLYANRDETFGNARLARNLFERTINNQATRMVLAGAVDEVSLITLYPEDVPIG